MMFSWSKLSVYLQFFLICASILFICIEVESMVFLGFEYKIFFWNEKMRI